MSTEQENVVAEKAGEVLAGDLLREKREALGISQQEIADRLRLKVSVIQSIDKNNFDFDQVATFTRGYLRSYAKAVYLDEKQVLAALDGVGDVQHSPQAMQSFSRQTKREKHDSRIIRLTVLIVAVIFGISSVWWYQNQQDTLEESTQSEVAESAGILSEPKQDEQVSIIVEPLAEEAELTEAEESVPEPVEVTVEDTPPETEASEPAQEPETVAVQPVAEAAPEQEPEPVGNQIVMNFNADCWVQVKDASGKTLVSGVKKAGQNLKVEGQPPYSVVLGAPQGVTMTFASEPVDLSGYNSGKVARFTLP